jgi:hypothetical protein
LYELVVLLNEFAVLGVIFAELVGEMCGVEEVGKFLFEYRDSVLCDDQVYIEEVWVLFIFVSGHRGKGYAELSVIDFKLFDEDGGS